MSTLKNVLDFILTEIKKENDSRDDGATISEDNDNQCLVNIFHDAMNKFSDIDFELIDDEDSLISLFGQSGFESIREAEHGL